MYEMGLTIAVRCSSLTVTFDWIIWRDQVLVLQWEEHMGFESGGR